MKASEVFDLPVSVGEYNMDNDNIYGASGEGEWCATFCSDEQAKVAANCINHADALADALAGALKILALVGPYSSAERYDIAWMGAALEAYRGVK